MKIVLNVQSLAENGILVTTLLPFGSHCQVSKYKFSLIVFSVAYYVNNDFYTWAPKIIA